MTDRDQELAYRSFLLERLDRAEQAQKNSVNSTQWKFWQERIERIKGEFAKLNGKKVSDQTS